jgi:quinol monooxygenase YgiN
MTLPAQYRIYRSPSHPRTFRIHDRFRHISWIYCFSSSEAAQDFIARLQAGSTLPSPDAFQIERR